MFDFIPDVFNALHPITAYLTIRLLLFSFAISLFAGRRSKFNEASWILESVKKVFSWTCRQPPCHEVDHGKAYPGFAALLPLFKVLRQTAKLHQPSEGAFHYPAARQHHEALLPFELGHDLERPARKPRHPVAEAAFAVPAISPQERQAREAAQELHQYQLGALVVLNAGAVHRHRQEQTQRVYRDVALAPLDLLAGIQAVVPPFCGVLTDWLSMIAAEGVGSLPSRTRTFSRRAS